MVVRWPTAPVLVVATAVAQGMSAPVYYQDPDGKPVYSPTPRKTADGRDYRPVFAKDDVSFDEADMTEMPTPAAGGGARKIKFYRNPMGLPDTSPTPKKDSMGMDYIPVYTGEDSDDGSVKLSAWQDPAYRRPSPSQRRVESFGPLSARPELFRLTNDACPSSRCDPKVLS